MTLLCVLLFFSTLTLSYNYVTAEDNGNEYLVNTTTGWVKGYYTFNEYKKTNYISFRGIPFAEPPVGKLRFKPPVPKQRWDGVFDARNLSHSCMQNFLPTYETMDEDCLTINVYVPDIEITDPLPVLFSVHFGELQSGSTYRMGPQYLMDKEVIIVMANYRVGSLGFLALNIPEATGNNGIKDTLLALKWTKENIAEFGGDPSKITLGGISAGSALANYLMIIEKSDGLFHRVILESGAALGNRFSPEPVNSAKLLADYLCDNLTDARSIYDCLIEQTATDINDAQGKLILSSKQLGFTTYTPFLPIVEIESEHRVIKEKPINSFRNGIVQNFPVLVGGNCEEGYKYYARIDNQTLMDYLNEDPTRYVPLDMYKLNSDKKLRFAYAIRQFYFNGGNITKDVMFDYFNLITDTQYTYPINTWLTLHKNNGNSSDAYYYNFCFDGQLNSEKILANLTYPGANHGDQKGYLFPDDYLFPTPKVVDNETQTTSDRMLAMWSNFIKTGNPTPLGFEIIWKPTKYPQMNYLAIDKDLKNVNHKPNARRIAFWEDLYNEYYAIYKD